MELITAIKGKNTNLALSLINAKSDVNFRNYGSTPLTLACYDGLSEVALRLIAAGADIHYTNSLGNTPLLFSCYSGSSAVALKLIELNVNINARNDYGQTPLIVACQSNMATVASTLIAKGADVNLIWHRHAPLISAVNNKMFDIAFQIVNSRGFVYLPLYDRLSLKTQKILSFNCPQYPKKFIFTLNDMQYLNEENKQKVTTLLLIRQQDPNFITLPNELFESVVGNLFV